MNRKISAAFAALMLLPARAYADFIQAQSMDEYISLTNAAVNESDSKQESCVKISEYDVFESCRLLMLADDDIRYRIADKIISSPDGQHIMFFPNSEETKRAYEYYRSQGANVIPDVSFSVESSDGLFMYPMSAHISYGPDFIHADEFNNILIEKYGSVENMPEIKIGVVDTGVNYEHELLCGRVDVGSGYDFANDDPDPLDDQGHGSHVSGIIADSTLSNVVIVPYKTLKSNGIGNASMTVNAINKACSDGNIDILNFSLSNIDNNLALHNYFYPFFKKAYNCGILSVVASGNEHSDANYVSPANIAEYAVTISACDKNGKFASAYSNYGSVIDFCSPGSAIKSALHSGISAYGQKSGTSMAAPSAASAFAMLKTYFPDYTNVELEQTMADNAVDAGDEGKDDYYGYGYASMENFVKKFDSETETTPVPEQLTITINGVDTHINSSTGSAVLAGASFSDDGLLSELKFYDITESCSITINDFSKIFIFESMQSLKPLHTIILK